MADDDKFPSQESGPADINNNNKHESFVLCFAAAIHCLIMFDILDIIEPYPCDTGAKDACAAVRVIAHLKYALEIGALEGQGINACRVS